MSLLVSRNCRSAVTQSRSEGSLIGLNKRFFALLLRNLPASFFLQAYRAAAVWESQNGKLLGKTLSSFLYGVLMLFDYVVKHFRRKDHDFYAQSDPPFHKLSSRQAGLFKEM